MTIPFASRLSLIAFAASAARAAVQGSGFAGGMTEGLWSMATFFPVGLIIGEIARRLTTEHHRRIWQEEQARARASESAEETSAAPADVLPLPRAA